MGFLGGPRCDAVLWAGENDMTGATSASCTRARSVTLLYRAEGLPTASGTGSFADESAGAYCANEVTWAVFKGVTSDTR